MARYDDLNTTFIGFFSIISSAFLLAVILAFQGVAYQFEHAEEERKQSGSEYSSATKVLGEQLGSLNGYKEVIEPGIETAPGQKSPDTKRIQIPIQSAMELILKENSQPKPAPAQT